MAEQIATVPCPETGEDAHLMKDKRGKYYLNTPVGVLKYQSARGQAILIEKYAHLISGEASNSSAAPETTSDTIPDHETEKPTKAKKVFSLFRSKTQ
ncbi:hypothetical protein AHAT_19090 [Agarivorans sp. Toyoura001]|uniref:hypothetical protein n=1 Tax=Agarivorans sp. Toyoura001 TaxID=2283141 RepID=UPI0010D3E9CD|nr:hypothetical protein [Agarivorans sp. Toyoura001]GDY26019.1 hypothetical protein AHAT_19090 [Agarivorans sp. Toyoura001]